MMIPPIIGRAGSLIFAAGILAATACSAPAGTGEFASHPAVADVSLSFPDADHDVAAVAANCTATCAAAANADTTCTAGVCGFTCHAGFADCDAKPENGCEVKILDDAAHCGGCDKKCGDVGNGSPTCTNGTCAPICFPGWMICQGDQSLCDTNVAIDVAHCGDCATACAGEPNATPSCFEGSCGLQCSAGFADCDGDATNGCETNTSNDSKHCGSCGVSCGSGQCIQSACECAAVSQVASLVPVDLFFMVDQSSSMNYPTGTGVSKWEAVVLAIGAFVQAASSPNLGVGIQYFPLYPGCAAGQKGCGQFSCNTQDYAVPEIPIAPLSLNSLLIVASLAQHQPLSGTPTYPALQGALSYAKNFAQQNPTHTVAVVMATDGVPDGCTIQDIASIAGLAIAGASGTPKVLTYVIGVGSSLSALNAIASGGATNAAYLVDTGANVVDQFGAALKAIQGSTLGCAYAIPQPASGQSVDLTKVNVQVTLSGGAPQLLNYVTSEAQCDPTQGGWHFDDPLAPTKILLCAPTCGPLGADGGAKVEILLGCDRATAP